MTYNCSEVSQAWMTRVWAVSDASETGTHVAFAARDVDNLREQLH